MANNITTTHGDKNDDSSCTASLLSPPLFTDFEIQCKPEPCSSLHNSIDEDLLGFDKPSTFHIPISVPMIKSPIVLLERCDKIWKTLQLIKIIQTEKPVSDDKEENKEEEVQYSDKDKQSVNILHQPVENVLRSHNTLPLPFKFSVQKTRKLYPCTICGKQYLERRSLRKHSERVHGIILPLLIKGRRAKNTSRLSNKKDVDKINPITLLNKRSNDLKKLNNDKNLYAHAKLVHKIETVKSTQPTKTVASRSIMLRKFVKCTLCQQKVTSIRKHLIHYHKIGSSSSVVEQLESSLLTENGASSKDKKTETLENISSKKSLQSAKTNMQDGFRIMDNEADIHKTSQVKRKRKYTLTYLSAKKRFKLNNERYAVTRHGSAVTQKQASLNYINHTNHTSYKCDICLGTYASPRSLYKHRRNHIFRGETKENFHNVKCRYHNSPFNKKYQLLQSSIMSTHTTVKNTSNSVNDKQLNNSKHETLFNNKQNNKISKINQAVRYNGKMNKNETTCMCGRSFRNPHTLFIHKKSCELCKEEDTMLQHTSVVGNDSGINITIKKLNDSYEIVGKDNNEDKLQKSEIHFKENNLSMSNTSDHTTKEFINLCAKQQELDISTLSNYSKDHSIVKLHVTNEDMIIDIEDDIKIEFDTNEASKRMVTRQDDKRSKEQNEVKNLKNDQIYNKIRTLKQMCQNILDVSTHKSETVENKNQENSQVEDQEIHQEDSQIKSQKMHQENKRKLRSSNKRCQNDEKKMIDNFNDRIEVCRTKFDPLSVCGYCNERFKTISLYDNHQCTVKQGKPFDKFSLELLCFYCKDVLKSFNEYDKHMKVEHFDNAYHCYLCIERFTSDKERLQHITLEHNKMSCRFCNEKISVRVKALHEGYHLGFGYPCHKCKKAYTNEKNLSYHNYKSRLHPKTDNLVTCTICLKSIKIRSFRSHMSIHKHNACYFCGKVFSNKTGIEFHTMIHHGTQSKLKCNICGTRFFTKKQLEKHAKVDGCNSGIQGMRSRNTAGHH